MLPEVGSESDGRRSKLLALPADPKVTTVVLERQDGSGAVLVSCSGHGPSCGQLSTPATVPGSPQVTRTRQGPQQLTRTGCADPRRTWSRPPEPERPHAAHSREDDRRGEAGQVERDSCPARMADAVREDPPPSRGIHDAAVALGRASHTKALATAASPRCLLEDERIRMVDLRRACADLRPRQDRPGRVRRPGRATTLHAAGADGFTRSGSVLEGSPSRPRRRGRRADAPR